MAFGAAIKKKSLGLPRYVGSKESLPIEFSPSDLWVQDENKNKGKSGKHEYSPTSSRYSSISPFLHVKTLQHSLIWLQGNEGQYGNL